MKTLLFSIILLFSCVLFAQQDSYKLIIDGKEVWYDVNTGNKINKPSKNTSTNTNLKTINSPIYKVKKGDTYYAIAKQNNITVETLYKINAINQNDVLIPGTSLFLIDKPETNTNTAFYHVVNKNDTLYSLARKYKTTVEKLLLFNELNSNLISINQRLRIK